MAIEEKTNEEIYVEATANSNNGVELKTYLYIIRMAGKSLRQAFLQIFMDLTEYVSAGYNPNDITVSIIYSAAPTAKISKPILYDASKNIYYCESISPVPRYSPEATQTTRKKPNLEYSLLQAHLGTTPTTSPIRESRKTVKL